MRKSDQVIIAIGILFILVICAGFALAVYIVIEEDRLKEKELSRDEYYKVYSGNLSKINIRIDYVQSTGGVEKVIYTSNEFDFETTMNGQIIDDIEPYIISVSIKRSGGDPERPPESIHISFSRYSSKYERYYGKIEHFYFLENNVLKLNTTIQNSRNKSLVKEDKHIFFGNWELKDRS